MTSPRCYLGWAVDRPDLPLYVQYGGTEAEAWKIALGWPSAEQIEHARANGARAFPIEIREVINAR
jgi:hypothetical protein